MKRPVLTGMMTWICIILFHLFCSSPKQEAFISRWPEWTTRVWIGPEYRANRLQDWRIHQQRLECVNGSLPLRTVHHLTRSLSSEAEGFIFSVQAGLIGESRPLSEEEFCGFLIGPGEQTCDAKNNQEGLIVGINGSGKLFLLDQRESGHRIIFMSDSSDFNFQNHSTSAILEIEGLPSNDNDYTLHIRLRHPNTREILRSENIENITGQWLSGNLALVANGGADDEGRSFWFKDWRIAGSKILIHDEHAFGPVFNVMYTLNRGVLNMTAQLPPIAISDPQTVRLDIRPKGINKWSPIALDSIDVPDYMVHFTLNDWESTRHFKYRVVYQLPEGSGELRECIYEGQIRPEPVDKEEIVVAALNDHCITEKDCNPYGHDGRSLLSDFQRQIQTHRPDLLICSSDLLKKKNERAALPLSDSNDHLDDLYRRLTFFRAYGEFMRDIPAVCLQLYVNPMKEEYPADLLFGGISFAILPEQTIDSDIGERAGRLMSPQDRETDAPHEDESHDRRQKGWLDKWSANWENTWIKVAVCQQLSQNNLAPADSAFIRERNPESGTSNSLFLLDQLRKSNTFIMEMDRNQAALLHYGTDTWSDAGISYCIPPVVDMSNGDQNDRTKGHIRHFKSTKGLYVTSYAAADSSIISNAQIEGLKHPTFDYGIIRLHKRNQMITCECWKIETGSDPHPSIQYRGWPRTIAVEKNDGRKAVEWLPPIKIQGLQMPIIRIYDEDTDELVYARRIKGNQITPKVFRHGRYTIRIGEPGSGLEKELKDVYSEKSGNVSVVQVQF